MLRIIERQYICESHGREWQEYKEVNEKKKTWKRDRRSVESGKKHRC